MKRLALAYFHVHKRPPTIPTNRRLPCPTSTSSSAASLHKKQRSLAAKCLTDLTAEIFKKKRELTAVAVEFVAPSRWYIGGTSLADQSLRSFYLDIKVTEGTNTKDEKALYALRAFAGIEAIVGTLHLQVTLSSMKFAPTRGATRGRRRSFGMSEARQCRRRTGGSDATGAGMGRINKFALSKLGRSGPWKKFHFDPVAHHVALRLSCTHNAVLKHFRVS